MSGEEEVRPLRKKTMTLSELQLKTLNLLRHVRFQFGRSAHEDGMSDAEFLDQFVSPLEEEIYADRQMLKMLRKRKRDEAAWNEFKSAAKDTP